MDIESVLNLLKKNHRRAMISKTQHFHAADRFRNISNMFNVPIIIINVALGSVFFYAITNDIPDLAKWLSASLALTAALLSGIRQFYNFESKVEAHRNIANQYLSIRDLCERYLAIYEDDNIDLITCLDNIQKRIDSIRHKEENYPTDQSDYKKALVDLDTKGSEQRSQPRFRKADLNLNTQTV